MTGEEVVLHTVTEGEWAFSNRWEWVTVTLNEEVCGMYASLNLVVRTREDNSNGLQIGHWYIGHDPNGGAMLK